MKKIIYLLLVVFGMNTPKEMHAQEILGVYPHYDSPCEGTVVNIYVDRSLQNAVDSIVWTKNGSKSTLPAGWTYDPQVGHVDCYGFYVVDNGNYEVTCYLSSGSVEMVNIQLSVNPNPNASYTLTPKCFGVVLQPIGADQYFKYDDHGGFSVPFTSEIITGNIVGGGFRAMNNNGCYTDVVVSPFTAPAVFGISLVPSKWQIKPGQSSTITASANWPVVMSKTKWYKDSTLVAQGCNSLTVTDTGLYKVQMRATPVSGGCVKSKQVRIKAKTVNGLRTLVATEVKDTEEDDLEGGTNGDEIEKHQSQSDLSEKSKLLAWPNPASDQIQITGYDENVEIHDMNGKLVVSQRFDVFDGNVPQTIDLSGFSNGIYFVRSGEQTVKLIVQR